MFRSWLRSVRRAVGSLAPKKYDPYARYAPRVAAALSHRGYVLFKNRDTDGAMQAFNDALVYAPKSAPILNNRACGFLERFDYDRAIQDCNAALEVDPTLASAICNRGSAYLGKLDLQRGAEDYDRCLALNPNYAVGYTNRCFVSLVSGNYEDAACDCDHAITLDPSDSLSSRNRGGRYESVVLGITVPNLPSSRQEGPDIPFQGPCDPQKRSSSRECARTSSLSNFLKTGTESRPAPAKNPAPLARPLELQPYPSSLPARHPGTSPFLRACQS